MPKDAKKKVSKFFFLLRFIILSLITLVLTIIVLIIIALINLVFFILFNLINTSIILINPKSALFQMASEWTPEAVEREPVVLEAVRRLLEGSDRPWQRRLLAATVPLWLAGVATLLWTLVARLEAEPAVLL